MDDAQNDRTSPETTVQQDNILATRMSEAEDHPEHINTAAGYNTRAECGHVGL